MNFILKIVAASTTTSVLLACTPAWAGSTALSPVKFIVAGERAGVVSEIMTVRNLSDADQHYSFYPEAGSGEKSLSVVPSQFVLAPQQVQPVVVRIRPAEKSWRANLNLVAYNSNQMQSNFRVGDGIKIPVFWNAPQVLGETIAITGLNVYLWLLTLLGLALALGLAAIVCWICYRQLFWRQIRSRHKISFV